MHGPSLLETRNKTTAATAFLVRMVGLEIRHRLRQLDTLQLLPVGIRRFLVDEVVPGPRYVMRHSSAAPFCFFCFLFFRLHA